MNESKKFTLKELKGLHEAGGILTSGYPPNPPELIDRSDDLPEDFREGWKSFIKAKQEWERILNSYGMKFL